MIINRVKMKNIQTFTALLIFCDSVKTVVCQECDCSLLSGNASPMFIALLVMLLILLMTVLALAVMVVRMKFSSALVRRGTVFQKKPEDKVAIISENTQANHQSPKKKVDSNMEARKLAVQSAIYAEPSNPNDESQKTTVQSDIFQYDTVRPISNEIKSISKNSPKGKKVDYAKVNKIKKENEKKQNGNGGKKVLDVDHYVPLKDGAYDHLHQRRATLNDSENGVYNNIDEGKNVAENKQGSNQQEQEVKYDTPRVQPKPDAEPSYDVPPSLNLREDTYDVPPPTDTTYAVPPPAFQVFDPEETYDKPPPASEVTKKPEVVYDRPPLIPTPFQEVYDVPKTGIRKVDDSS